MGAAAALVSVLLIVGCGADEPVEAPAAAQAKAPSEPMASLQPPDGAVPPAVVTANRVATADDPIGDEAPRIAASPKEGDDDAPKDYWKEIPFDRDNFDEVRKFVSDRYIDERVDSSRAFAEAAAFALASDEGKGYLLYPESFHKARRDHPNEKGRLKGKVTKLKPSDKFVILDEVEVKEDLKRLSDEEIAELRKQLKARVQLLDSAWRKAAFSESDFHRVMDFVKANLGKTASWTVKRAWVAAAQGYLYSLDPHSALIPKKAWEDSTRETTDASFQGIGAILTRRPAETPYTIVESPLEGRPAVKAGLRAGDVIQAVDGKSIKGELLNKVVKRIRGPKGTTVVLNIRRVGVPEAFDIPIVRSHIDIKNVQGKFIRPKDYPDIGYMKLTGFVPTTDRAMRTTFNDLTKKAKSGNLRGMVLDLRNNSGGLLKEGIKVADRFLSHGRIVSVRSRDGQEELHVADALAWDVPLVVLVNDGAASASEIVASAIQENGRGLVIGDRTFGKASVQTLFSPLLRDTYYIKLTVARYYSPSGRTLQVHGVKPDIEIAPEVGGKMPLGYREENLSHHLAPLSAAYPKTNERLAKQVKGCVKKHGKAVSIHQANPNPAVKFDYQLMYAADVLECMNRLGRFAARTP